MSTTPWCLPDATRPARVGRACPRTQGWPAPTVAELAEGLRAEILPVQRKTGELVEHMLVGAMSRRVGSRLLSPHANKAVVTAATGQTSSWRPWKLPLVV